MEHQNDPNAFKKLDLDALKEYAKRWATEYFPHIIRITLHKYHHPHISKLEEVLKRKKPFFKYGRVPTKYAMVFELSDEDTKSEAYRRLERFLTGTTIYDNNSGTYPMPRGPLRDFIDNCFGDEVYKQIPKGPFWYEWWFTKNDPKLLSGVKLNEPHWVLFGPLEPLPKKPLDLFSPDVPEYIRGQTVIEACKINGLDLLTHVQEGALTPYDEHYRLLPPPDVLGKKSELQYLRDNATPVPSGEYKDRIDALEKKISGMADRTWKNYRLPELDSERREIIELLQDSLFKTEDVLPFLSTPKEDDETLTLSELIEKLKDDPYYGKILRAVSIIFPLIGRRIKPTDINMPRKDEDAALQDTLEELIFYLFERKVEGTENIERQGFKKLFMEKELPLPAFWFPNEPKNSKIIAEKEDAIFRIHFEQATQEGEIEDEIVQIKKFPIKNLTEHQYQKRELERLNSELEELKEKGKSLHELATDKISKVIMDYESFVINLRISYENDSEIKIQEPGKGAVPYDCKALGFRNNRTEQWKTFREILQGFDHKYRVNSETDRKTLAEINQKLIKAFGKLYQINIPLDFKLYERDHSVKNAYIFKFQVGEIKTIGDNDQMRTLEKLDKLAKRYREALTDKDKKHIMDELRPIMEKAANKDWITIDEATTLLHPDKEPEIYDPYENIEDRDDLN